MVTILSTPPGDLNLRDLLDAGAIPLMRPIRILVDSFADEDGLNAQMTNARDMISRLDAGRFHVSTFVTGRPDPRLSERPATRLIPLGQRRQTFRILREFIWGRHDILFYLKASPAARLYLTLRPRWLDQRVVIGMIESQADLRNEPTVNPEQVRIWEQTVLRSDVLFSNSAAVKASLQREYGLSSEIMPTGVDTQFFTPAPSGAAKATLRVLFVGALRPFKGPQLLLRAAEQFPNVDFVIVGEGIMAAELERQVVEKGLSNVQFARGLNHSKLRDQYRSADIFLFPSRWEGSPKVILEAAACGLPVIARRDYEPETVIDGQTGLLGSNDDELLLHLGRLISDSDLRRNMGRAARCHIEQFDWDLIVRRWEQVFLNLATPRRDRHRS